MGETSKGDKKEEEKEQKRGGGGVMAARPLGQEEVLGSNLVIRQWLISSLPIVSGSRGPVYRKCPGRGARSTYSLRVAGMSAKP